VAGAFGVVEDEPLGQLLVERIQVGKEQVFVVVHEGLVHGSIEALDVRIQLGVLGSVHQRWLPRVPSASTKSVSNSEPLWNL
jgi:hypothetical protein